MSSDKELGSSTAAEESPDETAVQGGGDDSPPSPPAVAAAATRGPRRRGANQLNITGDDRQFIRKLGIEDEVGQRVHGDRLESRHDRQQVHEHEMESKDQAHRHALELLEKKSDLLRQEQELELQITEQQSAGERRRTGREFTMEMIMLGVLLVALALSLLGMFYLEPGGERAGQITFLQQICGTIVGFLIGRLTKQVHSPAPRLPQLAGLHGAERKAPLVEELEKLEKDAPPLLPPGGK